MLGPGRRPRLNSKQSILGTRVRPGRRPLSPSSVPAPTRTLITAYDLAGRPSAARRQSWPPSTRHPLPPTRGRHVRRPCVSTQSGFRAVNRRGRQKRCLTGCSTHQNSDDPMAPGRPRCAITCPPLLRTTAQLCPACHRRRLPARTRIRTPSSSDRCTGPNTLRHHRQATAAPIIARPAPSYLTHVNVVSLGERLDSERNRCPISRISVG